RADRAAARFLRAAVRGLHDPGTAAGHHREAALRQAVADLAGEQVVRMSVAEARRAEHGHARADEVQLPEAADAVEQHAQDREQLAPTAARSLEEADLFVARARLLAPVSERRHADGRGRPRHTPITATVASFRTWRG